MRYFFVMFCLLLLFTGCLWAQGLNFNDTAYGKVPQKRSFRTVSGDSLPARIDLSGYAPSVMNQGKWGTCVGFASAYYARTILEAVRQGITDRNRIDSLCFSPSFLYDAIKDTDDDNCTAGSEIEQALTYMRQNGVALLKTKSYPDCGANDPRLVGADSRIMDYIRLFGLVNRPESVVLATRKALSEMTPVIIGIQTTPSLKALSFWGKIWRWILSIFGADDETSLWVPSVSNRRTGGHAVCVVGYDSEKFGGAFRIINSWGKSWGDEGYFWMRYADYAAYTKYGYQAYLPIQADSTDVTLSAQVSLQFATFTTDNEVPFVRSLTGKTTPGDSSERMVAYTLRDAQPTGATFKFVANVNRLSYVYALAATAAELRTKTLFPVSDTISPIIGANTQLLLPSENLLYTLSGEPGHEYWLFLFAEKALDIEKYTFDMDEGSGTFIDRVQQAFGKDLVPYQQVDYDSRKTGFVLRGRHEGHIVPLLIGFDHRDK